MCYLIEKLQAIEQHKVTIPIVLSMHQFSAVQSSTAKKIHSLIPSQLFFSYKNSLKWIKIKESAEVYKPLETSTLFLLQKQLSV